MATRTTPPQVIQPVNRNWLMRLSDETKQAFLTTEFWVMVLVIIGILIACAVVDDPDGDRGPRGDQFQARAAWLWVAIVAVGYMASRGLAKAGTPHRHWADKDDVPKSGTTIKHD
jgi:hypothetical protein